MNLALILKTLLSGAKDAISTGSIDKLSSIMDEYKLTDEEVFKAEMEYEQQLTERLKADMSQDAWLANNVRPVVFLIFVTLFVIMVFLDGNGLNINPSYIPVIQQLLTAVITFYFGGRSLEKGLRIWEKTNKKK